MLLGTAGSKHLLGHVVFGATGSKDYAALILNSALRFEPEVRFFFCAECCLEPLVLNIYWAT